jgi:hypothetical protein
MNSSIAAEVDSYLALTPREAQELYRDRLAIVRHSEDSISAKRSREQYHWHCIARVHQMLQTTRRVAAVPSGFIIQSYPYMIECAGLDLIVGTATRQRPSTYRWFVTDKGAAFLELYKGVDSILTTQPDGL